MAIERVGVVGCGIMGSGIGEVCARSGCNVIIREVDDAAIGVARARLEKSLRRGVRAGKLGEEQAQAALDRIRFTTDFEELRDRELVVEAVVESEPEKLAVFEALDRLIPNEDVILASNTSSIPIMKLAMATQRPESVCGMHFFNPVPVLDLVELVVSLMTAREVEDRAAAFVDEVLGKRVIRSKDRAGFIVNMLLIPYLLSAMRMVESGFASKEDIDSGMVKGCNHPMGPLALADLIGLDTTLAVAESLYDEFREPLYAPPPLLSRMVQAGLLGRKSSRGFYEYGGGSETRRPVGS